MSLTTNLINTATALFQHWIDTPSDWNINSCPSLLSKTDFIQYELNNQSVDSKSAKEIENSPLWNIENDVHIVKYRKLLKIT